MDKKDEPIKVVSYAPQNAKPWPVGWILLIAIPVGLLLVWLFR